MHFKIKGFTSNWRSTQRLNIFDILQNDLDLDESNSELMLGDDEMKFDSETLESKLIVINWNYL